MWRTLRAELAYSRPVLLTGLAIAAGVATMVSVVFHLVGDEGPPPFVAAALRAMFLIMAPTIGSFVVQANRLEERRHRLLLAGPLTPLQLAGVMVLLPAILFVIGVLAAGVVIGAEFLITGTLVLESLQIVGYVGGLIFMMTLMGLLVQEAVAAHRERRFRAAAVGWASFAVAVLPLVVLPLAASQGSATWLHLNLGNLFAAAVAAAAGTALFAGRTDFTS